MGYLIGAPQSQKGGGAMSPAQAIAALDKAVGLKARAHNNYCKFLGSKSGMTKTAREALDRHDRYNDEADALFAQVRAHLES